MEEKTTLMKRIYEGRIVSLEVHDVSLPDGRSTRREVVRHGPAVAIVAEHPDQRFIFVRQYRKPVERMMWEVVAGCVDPGESLDAAAHRELREETGYTARQMVRIGAVYPSPGYVDERIEIYYARTAPEPSGHDLDEDEWVGTRLLTRTEALAMMEDGRIEDAKTLAAWWLYERKIRRGQAKEEA